MPELPEVEIVRQRLSRIAVGRPITALKVLDSRLMGENRIAFWRRNLVGKQIDRVHRRGKYLALHLDDMNVWISHLRMTGNWLPARDEQTQHCRAVITFEGGEQIIYADVRRFGTWNLLSQTDAHEYLESRLGSEPLGAAFTTPAFLLSLKGRRAPIKSLLLDQKIVAGIGNIYADESLYDARIDPHIPGCELNYNQADDLVAAIRRSVSAAISQQAKNLIDDATIIAGSYGEGARDLLVYGKHGQPCRNCGGTIIKIRLRGRATHLCPSCQRSPTY